ncbi:AraC family transcriptional regulator [uncultured Psychroserpens sp.]|uniref:helix-turn-helix domain-containing protein n=1 Tax=uncultured Psychroserpens sp. TaxID=255436 RepID=UPI0026388A0E|nr:AraC family transcriptional regulator [uncultured Psychroserpens sp.]
MKSLQINKFKGQETVRENKTLETNAAFYSKVNHFEGKLSSSHYVVKFPMTGLETYYTINKKIQVDNLSYLITNPHVEIEAVVKSKTPVIGICIGFTDEFLNSLATSIGQKMKLCLDNPFVNNESNLDFFTQKNRINNSKFGHTLQNIKYHLLNGTISEIYNEEQFYLTFGELLIENELNIHSKISQLPHSKLSTREEIYRRVDLMNHYIHDNFTEHISLENLSQIACLSKYHSLRCYQGIMNTTPYKKIIELRLKKAKELLSKGHCINLVADLCGFTDYRAFSKVFKKYYGLLPSIYQKQMNIK